MKNTPQVKKLNAHHIPQGDQCYKLQFTNLQKPGILKAKKPPFLHPLCAFSFLSMTIQSHWPLSVYWPGCVPTQPLAHLLANLLGREDGRKL